MGLLYNVRKKVVFKSAKNVNHVFFENENIQQLSKKWYFVPMGFTVSVKNRVFVYGLPWLISEKSGHLGTFANLFSLKNVFF